MPEMEDKGFRQSSSPDFSCVSWALCLTTSPCHITYLSASLEPTPYEFWEGEKEYKLSLQIHNVSFTNNTLHTNKVSLRVYNANF